jgi:uncharacterized protein
MLLDRRSVGALLCPPGSCYGEQAMESAVDPRPRLAVSNGDWVLVGARCPQCGYCLASMGPWCPICHSSLSSQEYGPAGIVWASTVLRVAVGDYRPPRLVAYVDLDDGPRILCHLESDADAGTVAPGTRVQLTGPSEHGDPMAKVTA